MEPRERGSEGRAGSRQHDQVGRLFLATVELPVGVRAEHLEQACAGDDGLRAEVESLLAHEGSRVPDQVRSRPSGSRGDPADARERPEQRQ